MSENFGIFSKLAPVEFCRSGFRIKRGLGVVPRMPPGKYKLGQAVKAVKALPDSKSSKSNNGHKISTEDATAQRGKILYEEAEYWTMNMVLKKYPNLGTEIFKELNNESLSQCRTVANSWKTSIENEKFYWIRKLQSCGKYRQEVYTFSSKNFLKKILKDSNVLAVKQMVHEAQNGIMEHTLAVLFTKAYFIPSKKYFSKKTFDDLKLVATKDDSNNTTPLHYAAEIGHLTICLLMIKKMEDKCPKTKLGCTPIHTAAYHGHLEVCRLMMEFSRDKNPKDFDLGRTPLHWAARKGHLHICKLIIDNTKNKNPKTINGVTPLHLAARYGHVNICQLILENISLDFRKNLQGLKISQIKGQKIINNPPNNSGWTPLHIASEFGQYHVVQLILKYVENKNPQNRKSSETTPMELAEFYGYSTIRCLIQNALDRQNPEPAVKRPRKTYGLRMN